MVIKEPIFDPLLKIIFTIRHILEKYVKKNQSDTSFSFSKR